MDIKQFQVLLSQLNSFRGADLRYADLQDENLRGANLRGVDLRYADLRDANLWGVDLQDVDLRYADLRGANFLQDVEK